MSFIPCTVLHSNFGVLQTSLEKIGKFLAWLYKCICCKLYKNMLVVLHTDVISVHARGNTMFTLVQNSGIVQFSLGKADKCTWVWYGTELFCTAIFTGTILVWHSMAWPHLVASTCFVARTHCIKHRRQLYTISNTAFRLDCQCWCVTNFLWWFSY